MGNNSEFARNTSNTVIDERTLREIYLPIFEAAVKEARVGAIMDSYNLTNGFYMTQNDYLNTEVAKNQWRFQGIIMSDWGATHDALGAANGGLDLEMPFGQFLNRKNLLPAVEQGRVSASTIDDKVRRLLRLAVQFGWLDHEQLDLSIPRYNQQGRLAALEGACEGMVLLKNEGGLLPLDRKKVKTIAVIGPDAFPAIPTAGGSGNVPPFSSVSILAGVSDALGMKGNVTYANGLPTLSQLARATQFTTEPTGGRRGLTVETFANFEASGTPTATRTERSISQGRAGSGIPDDFDPSSFSPDDFASFGSPPSPTSTRWTDYYTPKTAGNYTLFVQSSGGFRVFVDDKPVLDGSRFVPAVVNQAHLTLSAQPHKLVLQQLRGARFGQPFIRLGVYLDGSLVDANVKKLAAQADVAVVAVGFNAELETEGTDREFQLPPGQDELVRAIAAANKNTIVVVTSGGSVDVTPWVDQIAALIEAWYPGQEGGTALAELLFGDVNPSGHLPISWERSVQDNPSYATYYYTEPGTNKIEYREGIFTGYRGYEHNHVRPLFPFGYGLSYTTFRYGNLTVKPVSRGAGPGPYYEVSFDVTNTGGRAGADVAQVYVADTHAKAPRPPKELKGFARVDLRPGQTRRVQVTLNGRAFTYYDVNAKQWHADPGDFDILVGRSSDQIGLQGRIDLSSALDVPVGN
jgi:beta-glucosidase